jgi:adenosine kinase
MNDYESQLMMKITDLTLDDIASQVHALIVTRGGEGSRIYASGKSIDIPAASIQAAVDPTGCGDAFRAGLLYGLNCGWDWETSGRAASLVGAFKVERQGTQNHHFTENQFRTRFEEGFDYALP